MLNKKILLRLSLAILAIMLTTGLPTLSQATGTDAKATTAKKDANVIKGKVLGVSKKAKTITIKGKKGPIMVKFSDATKGMEFAKKGEAAIIKFTKDGDDKIATVVKQKLASPKRLVVHLATGWALRTARSTGIRLSRRLPGMALRGTTKVGVGPSSRPSSEPPSGIF